jgi:hypothetical protein
MIWLLSLPLGGVTRVMILTTFRAIVGLLYMGAPFSGLRLTPFLTAVIVNMLWVDDLDMTVAPASE